MLETIKSIPAASCQPIGSWKIMIPTKAAVTGSLVAKIAAKDVSTFSKPLV